MGGSLITFFGITGDSCLGGGGAGDICLGGAGEICLGGAGATCTGGAGAGGVANGWKGAFFTTGVSGGEPSDGRSWASSTTTSKAEQVALPESFSATTENRPASSSKTSGMYRK